MKKSRVIITGGAGFVGSNLCKTFLSKNWQVVAIDNSITGTKQNLEDFLTNEDNYLESTGFHAQAGLQFKLLMIDTFVIYRYTIAKDVVPGSDGFGALNIRLGFGF